MPIALFDKDGQLVKHLVEVRFPDDELLSMGLDPSRTEIAIIPGSDSGEAYKDFLTFMGVNIGGERILLSFVRVYVIGYYKAYVQKLEHQGKIGIYGLETIPESERKRVTRLLGDKGLDIVERLGPEQAAILQRRCGHLISNIHAWNEQAIEKLAQESLAAGKIIKWEFTRFYAAYPFSTTRENLYHMIIASERIEAEKRYYARCNELLNSPKEA